MIRVIDNTSIHGGEELQGMEYMEDHMKNNKNLMEDKFQNKHHKCLREEREAGAQVEMQEGGAQPPIVGNRGAAGEFVGFSQVIFHHHPSTRSSLRRSGHPLSRSRTI